MMGMQAKWYASEVKRPDPLMPVYKSGHFNKKMTEVHLDVITLCEIYGNCER